MTTRSVFRPLEVMNGVQPITDAPAFGSRHWRNAKSMRSKGGRPAKTGGSQKVVFYQDDAAEGVVRSIFSVELMGRAHFAIGTNSHLYDVLGNRLKDITPVGLPAGDVNERSLSGYGAGLYGLGLYGTALMSNSERSFPRIWFMDRYGDSLIAAPGNGGDVYYYTESMTNATKVPNSPTSNYSFVSNNTLIHLGAEGVPNRIVGSDQNDITNYTSSSTNQVFRDDIEGAGRLLSHVSVKNTNLIFTEHKTYTFRKVSLEAGVWEILPLDTNIGIIAPLARCAAKGVAFWMGESNFYMWRGGNVEIIPSNNPDVPHSTCLRYVFDDLNYGQKSKIFGWYNPLFDEVQFHYPSQGSNEPNRIARICLTDFSWWIDQKDRTAAESPTISDNYPRLSGLDGSIYYQEVGFDDDTEAQDFTLQSPLFTSGKKTAIVDGLIPDSLQTGQINVLVRSKLYPRSVNQMYGVYYSVSETTEKVEARVNGRYWDYTFEGSELDQQFHLGAWQEEVQEASER